MNFFTKTIKKMNIRTLKSNFLLGAILFFGAFIRLYKIEDYMTFLGDEGRDALVVYDILHGHLTFLGPTASVGGFFMGPIYYYFMAPFLWLFNYNPVGPAVMVSLFGVATIFLIYKIGTEFFNKQAGIIAALFYSISPLVIAYSRSSWNPNLMPFFSLLSLYLLQKGIQKNKALFFVCSGILFGIALQLHYTTLFLGAIIACYILFIHIFLRHKNTLTVFGNLLKSYLTFFVGVIIGFSPFLAFELRHGFPNTQSIIKFIFLSGETGGNKSILQTIYDVFFRLFGRLIANYPPPEQLHLFNSFYISLWYYAIVFLGIGSIVLLLYQTNKVFRKNESKFIQLSIFIFWLFGIIFFGFYKKGIYDYYFEFLFPLPFLLVGNLLSFLWKRNMSLKIIALGFCIFIFGINIQSMPFLSTPNRQLDQGRKIAEFVLTKTEGRPFNFALVTGGNSDHVYRYFFKLANMSPVVIQTRESDPKRTSVTDQLLVVCETIPCAPIGHPLWEISGFGRAEIAGKWDISVVQVYRLIHYKGK